MKLETILETLNTEFDKITWSYQNSVHIGIGFYSNIKIKLTISIDVIKSEEYTGKYLALDFAYLNDDGSINNNLINHDNQMTSIKLLSCITLAFFNILNETELLKFFNIIVLESAPDNIEKRINVYYRIAKKISQKLNMSVIKHSRCVIIHKFKLDIELVKQIIDNSLNDK